MAPEERIARIEAALGAKLPGDYRVFLATHRELQGPVLVVSSNPEYWGVASIFEIGDGADSLQTDRVHDIVSDVLPAGMIAVAEDCAGNLYLLDCRAGATPGAVWWWDHEQGGAPVERVADSFSRFLGLLVPDTEGEQ
jgi:hypothetical protein